MPEREVSTSKAGNPVGVLPDRAQPHAVKTEQAVLAAMLREPDSCIDLVVAQFRDERVFYSPAHRAIFKAILALHDTDGMAVDLISLAQLLREQKQLDAVGGELYLAEIDNSISTTVNLESWCRILDKYATLRRMIDVCSSSLLRCYDTNLDASRLIDQIETDIYAVRHDDSSHEIHDIRTLVGEEFKMMVSIAEKGIEVGIPTGFSQLDDYTGGLKRGEMFIIAARPSIGKTSLALNLIADIAYKRTNPRATAFFSLEMTAQQITRRLLCTEAQVPESALWSGRFLERERENLLAAATKISKAKLWIDPTGGLSIAELRAKARRLVSQNKIEVIFIDYLQLMTCDERIESRQQEVSMISGGIKKLAKELNIPIVVLAQLNREVDKNSSPNARPKLAHLRESGSIEQDADVVTFLHRNRDDTKKQVESAPAELIIEKNRNGRTGVIPLNFFPSRMEFQPAAPVDIQNGPALVKQG